MKRATFFCLALFCAGTGFSQAKNTKISVGLMDLGSSGISSRIVKFLTDRLIIELQNTGKFSVMERDKRDVILKEQGFQQTGACDQTACLVEAGRLLPIQKMIGGSVGKIGKTYSIQVRMVDLKTGEVEVTTARDYNQEIDYLLTRGMKEVALDLAEVRIKGRSLENGDYAVGDGLAQLDNRLASRMKDSMIIRGNTEDETRQSLQKNLQAGPVQDKKKDTTTSVAKSIAPLMKTPQEEGNGNAPEQYQFLTLMVKPLHSKIDIDDTYFGSSGVEPKKIKLKAKQSYVLKISHDYYNDTAITITPKINEIPFYSVSLRRKEIGQDYLLISDGNTINNRKEEKKSQGAVKTVIVGVIFTSLFYLSTRLF